MRMRDVDGSERSTVVSSLGLSAGVPRRRPADHDPGLGARAMQEGRLVVVDKSTDPLVHQVPERLAPRGPPRRHGRAGPSGRRRSSAASGSRSDDPNRSYSARDQQPLLALAEHTSLALNHARALDDVAHEAFHDSLTGMPNRALFLDRALVRRRRAPRAAATPVGVLFIDLDDFKTINDILGHRGRRRAAVKVAGRLRGRLRPSDTIARLGGDEFAVLIEEVDEPGDAAPRGGPRARRAQPTRSRSRAARSTSAPASGSPPAASDAETLLRDADLAMYRAKAEGKGRYRGVRARHAHRDRRAPRARVRPEARDRARRARSSTTSRSSACGPA